MLAVGESVGARIYARRKWNDTQVDLVAGHEYACTAEGRWVDLLIPSDADGYASGRLLTLRLTERLRRVPSARWFALIGVVVGAPEPAFLIGKSRMIVPLTGGRLKCFANDLSFMYWNNYGSVQLTVTRLA